MVTHGAILRGLGATTSGAGPLILKRTDPDFVRTVLEQARAPAPAELLATVARDTDRAGTLRLFQPVHRTFHLAMFEVVCDAPGAPRLDPDRIDSSGLVVRRVAGARGSSPYGDAWQSAGPTVHGWVPLRTADEGRRDPDPARRRLPDQGRAALNERLRDAVEPIPLAEDHAPMFVAPADVCADAGRTILFALIPTVSPQLATVPLDAGAATESLYDDDELAAQVPPLLRAGPAPSISELAGRSYTYESADSTARAASALADPAPAGADSASLRASKQMYGFLQALRVLAIQLDVFGEGLGNPRDAAPLREELAAITLTFPGGQTRDAASFLRQAAERLVLSPGTGQAITMPTAWPALAAKAATRIRSGFGRALQARFRAFVPTATRFDDPAGRYVVRGLVRVRRDDGCPPDLVWSELSAPYRVVPWYDNGDAPPLLVRLPRIDRNTVKKLKPNVAFAVPGGLFDLLARNRPKDLIDGNGKPGSEGGVDWVCGFNIPIITLCAFIVLYIFLTLFHIIFWWLPFIRICFPIPRRARELVP
jgi:hypothetical protein